MDKMFVTMKNLENSIHNKLDDPKRIKSKLIGGQVCKYWLENRCKKGENCEYLHENIKEKLPECPLGMSCPRVKDCPFKHTLKIVKDCPSYNAGYCKDGKHCKLAHIQKEICINYILGFCPDGPLCNFFHLRSLIHPGQDNLNYLIKQHK